MVFVFFHYSQFQSAPLTKARGDFARGESMGEPQRFNPLPSQKQGETRAPSFFSRKTFCFNPLPSQKQGETWRCRRSS